MTKAPEEYAMDKLDKKIIKHLCNGFSSYSELAEKCDVGRNTVYRRIDRLRARNVIDKRIRTIPNFTNLGLSAICVMMDIAQSDVTKVIGFLERQIQVKFLWRTFGSYNITTVFVCSKGEEGRCVSKLKESLEKMGVSPNKFEVAIGYTWEKINFSPF